jgi:cellulose synthase/poly-beta-1,6-N-acetylglucosamine synthase-like glycosyltransferase
MYVLAAIAILQGILTLLDGIRAARHMRLFRPQQRRHERVVVFCPCKGVDVEFEKNVQSILNQDYPNYTVQFIVESDDDAAYALLRELGVDVHIAGRTTSRGQKVHNLAYAVEQTDAADIYVFCDSDARYPSNWLTKLISPLDATSVTTGYRWYVADRLHFSTLVRSAWNASSVSILGDHNRNFAWGGSTAIYRETFHRLKVLDAWRGAVSDDYAITRAAQGAGHKVVFVPECLIPTYGRCSFRELLQFTTRQIVITRIYHAALWRVGFAGHIVFNAAFWTLAFTHPGLWAVVYALAAVKSWIRYHAAGSVLPRGPLLKYGWFYILSPPLVAMLYLYNMIASVLSTEIVWRDIRYELLSPNETRVFDRKAASE